MAILNMWTGYPSIPTSTVKNHQIRHLEVTAFIWHKSIIHLLFLKLFYTNLSGASQEYLWLGGVTQPPTPGRWLELQT